MKTRAKAKGAEPSTERKISLTEAKRNSRQRMGKSSTDNVVRDIYGNVRLRVVIAQFSSFFSTFARIALGTQLNEFGTK